MTRNDALRLTRTQLMEALCSGHAMDPRELDDTEYRGVSLGLPAWVDRLAWKTFKKAFHRDPLTGHLRGWNVRLEQLGIDGPSEAMQKNGAPFTFGHFRVMSPEGYRLPKPCGRGLLLDYGLGGNPRFDPSAWVRDPIVALNPGDHRLLLGWSYLDLGFARVGTPSFFTLEREGPLRHPVAPPNP